MKKVYTFEIVQLIEVEAETKEEAIEFLPLPQNGFEGQGYYVADEEITLRNEREVKS